MLNKCNCWKKLLTIIFILKQKFSVPILDYPIYTGISIILYVLNKILTLKKVASFYNIRRWGGVKSPGSENLCFGLLNGAQSYRNFAWLF